MTDTARLNSAAFAAEPGALLAESEAEWQLGPDRRLDCELLERVAGADCPQVALSGTARALVQASHGEFLRRWQAAENTIFSATVGLDPLMRSASSEQGSEQGASLMAHLDAGWGAPVPEAVVRAAMLIRAQTLAQGGSGVRVATVESYLALLRSGVTPVVPEIGSGGDLIPLAHIARALAGEGEVFFAGYRMPADQALIAVGLKPLTLDSHEGPALTNGSAFLTAYAALTAARTGRLLRQAELLTGWLCRTLGSRLSALDPRVHRASGYAGQQQSAATILAEAQRDGDREDRARSLPEIYPIRSAPQTLGACRENLKYARYLIETEMNGVSGNPMTVLSTQGEPDEGVMLLGGSFHGGQVAFAADACNAALTQAGLLAERQIDALLDPRFNGGAPLLLAWERGANRGLAGAQTTAATLAAEMRAHCQHYACGSLPAHGDYLDIVSMGAQAAREAFGQTGRLAAVLAVLGMGLVQLDFLRAQGRAPGRPSPLPLWMPPFTPFAQDRPLQHDIARITDAWLMP